jgi:hypothetical protein
MIAKRKRKTEKREPTDKRILDMQQQRLALRHELGLKVSDLNRKIIHLREDHAKKIAPLDAAIKAIKTGEPVTMPDAVPTTTITPMQSATSPHLPPPVDPKDGGFIRIAGNQPLTHRSLSVERA